MSMVSPEFCPRNSRLELVKPDDEAEKQMLVED